MNKSDLINKTGSRNFPAYITALNNVEASVIHHTLMFATITFVSYYFLKTIIR